MIDTKIENCTKLRFNTTAVKTYSDPKSTNRPLGVPIYQSVKYQAESTQIHGDYFRQSADTFYMRIGNPTVSAAADKIAELERGEKALVFSTGMGAISTTLLAILKHGDHLVVQKDIYGHSIALLVFLVESHGLELTFVDATIISEISTAIKPNTTAIYIETPSNPLLKIVDIQAVARLARQNNLQLLVDSTFGSPYLQNPLELGATLAIHSGTKYLNGHADILCGAIVGSAVQIDIIRQSQLVLGTVLDPHAAWLLLRGMKTLGIRMGRQIENALNLANYLEGHTGVAAVHYPWLESSPYYSIAQKQMSGGGGVLSFEVAGNIERARTFVDALTLIPTATSLGGVESVIEIPAELDYLAHSGVADPVDDSEIPDNLIRLAVGIEDIEDLKADLERGFDAVTNM